MNQDVQEAIARARAHLHNAKREGLEATRALLEAALHAGAANESGQASLCADLGDQQHDSVQLLLDLRENTNRGDGEP